MQEKDGAAALAIAPRIGVSVCVWRGDEVLLVKRGKPPSLGLWSPVGGMVEPGESLADAASRETMEETGVSAAILGISGLREIISRDPEGRLAFHVVLVVHAARWLAGEPCAGDDACDAAWFAVEALEGIDLVEGALPYILATRGVAKSEF